MCVWEREGASDRCVLLKNNSIEQHVPANACERPCMRVCMCTFLCWCVCMCIYVWVSACLLRWVFCKRALSEQAGDGLYLGVHALVCTCWCLVCVCGCARVCLWSHFCPALKDTMSELYNMHAEPCPVCLAEFSCEWWAACAHSPLYFLTYCWSYFLPGGLLFTHSAPFTYFPNLGGVI